MEKEVGARSQMSSWGIRVLSGWFEAREWQSQGGNELKDQMGMKTLVPLKAF